MQAIKARTTNLINGFLILCGFTLLCGLGCWQLYRGHQKQLLLTQAHTALQRMPLSARKLLTQKPSAGLRFTPVAFKSHYDNAHTILLDNKIKNGQAGYHVLIPAHLDAHTLILVDQGWIPLGRSRKVLPQPTPIIGEVTIEGLLDFAYRNPFVSQAVESQTLQWPLRMQQLEFAWLEQCLGKTIYPMLVLLDSPPVQETLMTPARHQGYAVQWFALAVTLLLFYYFFARKVKKT